MAVWADSLFLLIFPFHNFISASEKNLDLVNEKSEAVMVEPSLIMRKIGHCISGCCFGEPSPAKLELERFYCIALSVSKVNEHLPVS